MKDCYKVDAMVNVIVKLATAKGSTVYNSFTDIVDIICTSKNTFKRLANLCNKSCSKVRHIDKDIMFNTYMFNNIMVMINYND